MAAAANTSSNRFRLASVDTIRFGSEDILTPKLGQESYARVQSAVQTALVEHAQFQSDLAASKSSKFDFNWNGQTLSYRIGDGEWREIPADQKIIPLFSSSIKGGSHESYERNVSPLRKIHPIDWESPELQESARRIEKVKEHIQKHRNLDGTEKHRSIKRSVGRRVIEPLFDTFSFKKHIIYSIYGDQGRPASIWLGYASVPINLLAGYLVEKSGKKILDESVKFEDAEGIRDGRALYYQGKLLKYGSVALGASLATEMVADKVLTGSAAAHATIAGTVLGTGGLLAIFAYSLMSAGYTGYNAYRCIKFRHRLNQRLNPTVKEGEKPPEEHEKQRVALEYLHGLLIPKDEDVMRVIEEVKNDKSIPLDKEEEEIEKKIENLFISRVQYLTRRCGTKSVRQIIEKAPELIEKLQSEDRETRDKAVEESKEIIKCVKGANLQKALLYTILFIAALVGIAALLITFTHGAILATFILGGLAAGISASVGIYILGQYLWFIYQHRKENGDDTAENAPHEKMPIEPVGMGIDVAII